MEGHQNVSSSTGPSELNRSYYTGNSLSALHPSQQFHDDTVSTSVHPLVSTQHIERCSHIVVLSSLPANWLALCGFGCLEFCVCPSQSVISCASLTLCEAGTCATRSCIYCLYLHVCTICSVASLLSLWYVHLFSSVP